MTSWGWNPPISNNGSRPSSWMANRWTTRTQPRCGWRTLSLSGAMPGLVGAAMRRGGPVAALRSSITFGRPDPGGLGTRTRPREAIQHGAERYGAGIPRRRGTPADRGTRRCSLKEQPVLPWRPCAEALVDGSAGACSRPWPLALRTGFTRFSVSVEPPADCP